MAIAFDAFSEQLSLGVTSQTTAHTCTGTNRILFVNVQSANVTGVTYNAVAMTQIATTVGSFAEACALYYLVNPASGANNIVVSRSDAGTIRTASASYTGAKQSGVPDASGTAGSDVNVLSAQKTITTVADNSWIVVAGKVGGSATSITATNDGARRNTIAEIYIGDSNSDRVPPGSHAGGFQWSASQQCSVIVASFAPADAFAVEQEGYRFRNDKGGESSGGWLAAQDKDVIAPRARNTRLRVLLNSTGDQTTRQYQLEYKPTPDGAYAKVLTANTFPTFRARGNSVASAGGGDVTPTWPTHQQNDVALLFVETPGGQAASLSTANGFAAVTNSPQATGATTAGTQLTVYWCRATSSSMANPVVTPGADHGYAIILTFRGCATSGNPWDLTAGSVKAGATTTTTWDAVTTTVENSLVVFAAARDNDSAAAAWSSFAGGNVSNHTENTDEGTASGNGGGIVVNTATLAAPGSTGAPTATVTSSINAQMTIALRPVRHPVLLAASPNITASGANTTAQLLPPSGKAATDFVAGRIQCDENPADTVDVTADDYTEMEWCLAATPDAANGTSYPFRVTTGGSLLNTYSVTPQWTIGPDAASPGGGVSYSGGGGFAF